MSSLAAIRRAMEDPRSRSLADKLFSGWIDEAPRFGAVAAHFPESLRKRRFVASFWAPEVLLFGLWYLRRSRLEAPARGYGLSLSGRTRGYLDEHLSTLLLRSARVHGSVWHYFWSPELPEVRPVSFDQSAGIWYRILGSAGWAYMGCFWRGEQTPHVARHPQRTWLKNTFGSLALLLVLALPAGAQVLFGSVTRIADGDTLTVGKARIRLYGIDAPEMEQWCGDGKAATRCGERAKRALDALAPVGAPISCRVMDADRYGRLVAICSIASKAGSDIARDMVLQGWAVAYRKYSDRYVAEEAKAKNGRQGIWAGDFEQPEEWRHGH